MASDNAVIVPPPLKYSSREHLLKNQSITLNKSYENQTTYDPANGFINLTFNENSIQFALNDYSLSNDAQSTLKPLIDVLSPRNTIKIVGHTCDLGEASLNQRLSKNRALEVENFIRSRRKDINDLESIGLGESRPMTNNSSETDRMLNRRVEIYLEVDKENEPSDTSNAPAPPHAPQEPGPDQSWIQNLLKEYDWVIVSVGLFAAIFSSADIIRNWMK